VDTRGGVDAVEKTEISSPRPESKPDRPVLNLKMKITEMLDDIITDTLLEKSQTPLTIAVCLMDHSSGVSRFRINFWIHESFQTHW